MIWTYAYLHGTSISIEFYQNRFLSPCILPDSVFIFLWVCVTDLLLQNYTQSLNYVTGFKQFWFDSEFLLYII